jgi:hypothetical protein
MERIAPLLHYKFILHVTTFRSKKSEFKKGTKTATKLNYHENKKKYL